MRTWMFGLAPRLGMLALVTGVAVAVLAWTAVSGSRAHRETVARAHAEMERYADGISRLERTIHEIRYEIVQVWQWFTDLAATRGEDGLDDGERKALAHARILQERLAAARRLAESLGAGEVRRRLEALAARVPGFVEAGRRLARAYVEGGTRAGNAFMPRFDAEAESLTKALEALMEASEDLRTGARALLKRRLEEMEATALGIERAAWFATPPAMLFSLLLTLYAAFGIALPLHRLAGFLRGNEGTRGAVPGVRRRDEIGALARALAELRERLGRAAGERREALLALARQLEGDVAEATARLGGGARELRGLVEELARTAGAAEERGRVTDAALAQVRTLAHTVARSGEELAGAVGDVRRRLEEASRNTGEVARMGEDTRGGLDRLTELARGIDEITATITEIAERTHLLALNATIEAARAGESGRGFAVVAGEVKALAQQTAEATRRIGERIAAMREASAEAVETVGTILDRIGEIDRITDAIAAAVAQQHAASRAMGDRVAETASALDTVANGIAAFLEDLGRNRERASRLSRLAERLDRATEGLRGELVQRIRKAVPAVAGEDGTAA